MARALHVHGSDTDVVDVAPRGYGGFGGSRFSGGGSLLLFLVLLVMVWWGTSYGNFGRAGAVSFQMDERLGRFGWPGRSQSEVSITSDTARRRNTSNVGVDWDTRPVTPPLTERRAARQRPAAAETEPPTAAAPVQTTIRIRDVYLRPRPSIRYTPTYVLPLNLPVLLLGQTHSDAAGNVWEKISVEAERGWVDGWVIQAAVR